MQWQKVTLTVLAGILILTGVGATGWAADNNEVPWVKPPPTIEQLTGGKVHTGEVINAQNVDLVRPYLLESFVRDVQDGWTFTIAPTTPSALLVPPSAVKATMENIGKATVDANGTVVTRDGKPWPGGFPAPYPKTAAEVLANSLYHVADQVHTLADEFWIDPQGHKYKDVKMEFDEFNLNGRTCNPPLHYVPGYNTELLRELAYDIAPYDVQGISILSIIYNDQTKLPDAWGYIPVLRRVQRFSSAQRYDSMDGSDFRVGDANAFSDPISFWNLKLIARKPMLYPLDPGYPRPKPGVGIPLVKGKYPAGMTMQLRDVYLIEARPKDPDHIYSKKIIETDSAMWGSSGDFYDRQGKLWIGFHAIYSPHKDPCGNDVAAAAYIFHNYQTGSVTLNATYEYMLDDPNLTVDDFTLRRISTLSR